jgi:transposase-like protein
MVLKMSKKKMLSFTQFVKRFPNEKSCVEYLHKIKWPDGFECPVCGCRHGYTLKNRRQYQCANCRHQTSLTANTVMHRTHLPLTKWFWAIYLVACDKRGISALALAGKIEVCYETAWNMLRRIRAAMEMRDEHYILGGIVEFDDSYFGAGKKGNIPGKGGRARGNQAVFVAVSKDEQGHPVHLRMQLTPNVQSVSIEDFARSRIARGSIVQTDGFNAYRKPLSKGYLHEYEVYNPDGELLKWLHHMIGNAKTFINGTYHGTSTKHLQMYLSEFCYRFNRRKMGGAIFDRLLVAIVG